MAKSGQSSKSPDCICLIISAIRLGNVLDIVKVLKFAFLRNDTFPRGRLWHRLHRPLLPHLPFPPSGKVPDFSAKTVHFPPGACMGTGFTCLSRRTCSLSLPGKCRDFPRKRFTFPRGRQGHRLHMPLSPHSQSLPPGKVPGFSTKTVHFPPRLAGAPALQTPLAALAVSPSRESAGNFGENGSLSPVT